MDVGDFFQTLRTISQNQQIMSTAWPMRVLNAWLWEDQYPAAAAISQYAQNMFRDMAAANNVIEWLMAYRKWWEEWFWIRLENNYERWSTWALRYQVWYIPWVVTWRSSGIDTIFWGENEMIDMYYWKNLPALQTRIDRIFEDWVTWEEAWDFFKQLMGVNKLYKAVASITDAKKPERQDVSAILWDIYWSELYQKFNKTGKFVLPNDADDDTIKYIINSMTYRFAPWTSDWWKMVENYLKTDKAFIVWWWGKETYDLKERDWMDKVLGYMKADGTLQQLYNLQQFNNDQPKAEETISNFMIDYIANLPDEKKKELPWRDWMILKIANTNALKDYTSAQKSERAKNNKRLVDWKLKNWTVWEWVMREINKQFIRNNIDALQEVYTDATIDWRKFSNLWLDLTMYAYAKQQWIVDKDNEYFYIDDATWEAVGLKDKYKSALKKLNVVQQWVRAWKNISDLAEEAYWAFWMFPTKTTVEWTKEYDTEILTKTAMYVDEYARNINIPRERRIELITANMAFLWDKVLSVSDVRKSMWDDFADSYANHLYQSYKDAVQLAHDVVEWWGKWSSGKSINVPSFSLNLSKFKKYVEENAWEIYKPFVVKSSPISPYSLVPETAQQRMIKPPTIPTNSAKSKRLFASVKAKKSSIPTAWVKPKSLSSKKSKWAKKA